MEKIYEPEVIPDNPFPTSMAPNQAQSQAVSGGVTGAQIIQSQPLPLPQNADNVISPHLDTKTRQILAGFTFSPTGALRIGSFAPGKTGEIDIDPDGIIARDINGDPTITIDALTGDITIRGELSSGSILSGLLRITGKIIAGKKGNTVIDGNGIHLLTSFLSGFTTFTTTNSGNTLVPGSNIKLTTDSHILISLSLFAYIGTQGFADYQKNASFASLNMIDDFDASQQFIDLQSPGVPGTYLDPMTSVETLRTQGAPVSQTVIVEIAPGVHNFNLYLRAVGDTAKINAWQITTTVLGSA